MRIIYKATFPDGKSYIGYTTSLAKRKREHKCCDGSSPYFHAAIKKFGFDCIVWSELEICDSVFRARAAERRHIKKHKSNDERYGYNDQKGGKKGRINSKRFGANISARQTGRKRSEESKRKQSIAMTGFKHTEETKRKISEKKKGHKAGMTGKRHTESTRRQMSETHKRIHRLRKESKARLY